MTAEIISIRPGLTARTIPELLRQNGPMLTGEIAHHLGISGIEARLRLIKMRKHGLIKSKLVSHANGIVGAGRSLEWSLRPQN